MGYDAILIANFQGSHPFAGRKKKQNTGQEVEEQIAYMKASAIFAVEKIISPQCKVGYGPESGTVQVMAQRRFGNINEIIILKIERPRLDNYCHQNHGAKPDPDPWRPLRRYVELFVKHL